MDQRGDSTVGWRCTRCGGKSPGVVMVVAKAVVDPVVTSEVGRSSKGLFLPGVDFETTDVLPNQQDKGCLSNFGGPTKILHIP